jgi:hypothetical protein
VLLPLWVLWWGLLQQSLLRCRLLHWGFFLLVMKSIYGLLQLCLCCSLLLDLLLCDLSSLHDRPLFGHVLLHEPKVFVLLAKACQLIFYDDFDFILRVLLLIFLGFGFSVQVLVVVLLLL